MPSSVVFAALVLAWLVVLVPVVARRRQMVPRPAEADLSGRVLRRPAGTPLIEEVPVATVQTDGSARDERAVPAAASGPTGTAGRAEGSSPASGGATRAAATALAERPDETPEALDAELDLDADRDDLDEYADDRDEYADRDDPRGTADLDEADDAPQDDRPAAGRERVLPRRPPEDRDGEDGEYDEYEAYDEAYDDTELDDEYEDYEYDEYEDDAGYDDGYDDADEPVGRELRTYRPGRGGFDPDAAAAAAHARYTFRQRIALGLIAVAVLSALAALVVSSAMWWVHLAADVVLVGYLIFLRRQTRIEEEVRIRRAARLSGERRALEARRARQAEHEARMAALRDQDWIDGSYEEVEEDGFDEDDHRVPAARSAGDDRVEQDEAPRWAAPRTPPPPVPEDLELVDDSDDDPAFHDLDGERTYGYRRAAGA